MSQSEKKIYLLFTRTQTRIGFLIRLFSHAKYNHCAIALDRELTQLYSFARPQQHGIFLGKFVKESYDRYLLNSTMPLDAALVELSVSNEQYQMIEQRIHEIETDDEYMYNFVSVLTYPVLKGMKVYKSYSCSEFVASLLQMSGQQLNKSACSYTPDDLFQVYERQTIYRGSLAQCMKFTGHDEQYYCALTFSLLFLNMAGIMKIIRRFAFSVLTQML